MRLKALAALLLVITLFAGDSVNAARSTGRSAQESSRQLK
jgi:hypothetical protein